jgi:hypothetical protein
MNASKRRIRHDLAQGKWPSTLEVTQILRVVWFIYSLVRSFYHDPPRTPFCITFIIRMHNGK